MPLVSWNNKAAIKAKFRSVKAAHTETKALSHQPSRRHVLFRFDLTEVEGAGEHQNIYHGHETGQESDCCLWRHALRRLNVLQLRLGRQKQGTRPPDSYCVTQWHKHGEMDALCVGSGETMKQSALTSFHLKTFLFGKSPAPFRTNKQEEQPSASCWEHTRMMTSDWMRCSVQHGSATQVMWQWNGDRSSEA